MAELPGFLMPHRVTVEPYLGDSSEDSTYGPLVESVPCRQEGTMTVNAEGEHVGSVKLYLRLAYADRFTVQSRVQLDPRLGGGTALVEAAAPHDDGGMGGWQHLEVSVA